MLIDWKAQQDEMKEILGDEYMIIIFHQLHSTVSVTAVQHTN